MNYSNKTESAIGAAKLAAYGKTGQGVGGVKNPNPMSVFEANAGHYPFCHESGGKVTFDKSNRK